MNNKLDKSDDNSLNRIKELAKKADENKAFELGLEEPLDFKSIKIDFGNDIQNPDKSYKIFYAIQGILKSHLPQGENNKEIRDLVREEKTIFLTGGKKKDAKGIRGADSRQAYISTHLEVALNTLFDWLNSDRNFLDLFLKFRDLNIKYGYFEQDDRGNADQSK